jgi:hypothetical protein
VQARKIPAENQNAVTRLLMFLDNPVPSLFGRPLLSGWP